MTDKALEGRGGPITRVCRVPVDEWQYFLIQPDQDPIVPAPLASDGFVATAGGGVFITSATESGEMPLTAEFHTAAPPLAADEWEDVSEVSVLLSPAPLLICSFGFVPVVEFPLADDHTGPHRLRVHGRNRDAVHGRGPALGGPSEQHLIQLWPEPDRPSATLKQTSAFSGMMRPR